MRLSEEDYLAIQSRPTRRRGESFPCEDCGIGVMRTGAMQRFCEPCSATRNRKRQQRWSHANPRDPVALRESARSRDTRRKDIGRLASAAAHAGIFWPAEEPSPDASLWRLVRVRFPFDYKLSKNAVWSLGAREGHVFARKASKSRREALALMIRGASMDRPWFEGKVWIDILVEKPNMRGDAINVVDLVCDAVKDAIGVDDRWFCIRRVDWRIVKVDPCIFVGVGQAVTEHHRACSCCGQVKLLVSGFGSNRANRLGRARECSVCSRAVERERSTHRRAQRNNLSGVGASPPSTTTTATPPPRTAPEAATHDTSRTPASTGSRRRRVTG